MAAIRKLKLSIKTGSEPFSGTHAHLYVVLGTVTGGSVYRLPTKPEQLEIGKLDIFDVQVPDPIELDDLRSACLVSGMNGPNPAWRLLWVRVDAVDAQGHSWRLADAMIERWLDSKDDTAPVAVVPLNRPFASLGANDIIGATTEALIKVA